MFILYEIFLNVIRIRILNVNILNLFLDELNIITYLLTSDIHFHQIKTVIT